MKMLHVTIQTNKFEEEIRFYREIVGLEITGDMRSHGRNLVFLSGGEDQTAIEIIENPEVENAGGAGLSIGFKTEDVEKKHEDLAAQGFEVSPILSPVPNVRFFFATDPAGVKVQFI